jgi:hypothetical protein
VAVDGGLGLGLGGVAAGSTELVEPAFGFFGLTAEADGAAAQA